MLLHDKKKISSALFLIIKIDIKPTNKFMNITQIDKKNK